jgi:heme-degrading monooxygenase HmoA
MIARVWEGVVPLQKADAYAAYLGGEFGVEDYRKIPGNQGSILLRRDGPDQTNFLFISFWASREAIQAYAGSDIDRARYYAYDLECLLDPTPTVRHYQVLESVSV